MELPEGRAGRSPSRSRRHPFRGSSRSEAFNSPAVLASVGNSRTQVLDFEALLKNNRNEIFLDYTKAVIFP